MRLHEFITEYRTELVARTRTKVAKRPLPSVSVSELETGVPLFLTQLAQTLLLENTTAPFSANAIGTSAALHGRALLARGFSVSQVVHDYGDVCQAVTELAVEKKAAISAEEFHTMNRCLDTAIAEAVTEFGRLQAEAASESSFRSEVERRGRVAHELRNGLQVALLSFEALKTGKVGISGSTGTLLGRSLADLRELIDRGLSEVRMESGIERHDRLPVAALVNDVATAANLHAEHRAIRFTVEPVDPALMVTGDAQLLASALMNLLQNAFKFTPSKGLVRLRTRAELGHVLIEIEDECGGLGKSPEDLFLAFGDRRGKDRSGLGLGLSISRKAVKASGGEISAHDLPGKGCIFTIDLPSAA